MLNTRTIRTCLNHAPGVASVQGRSVSLRGVDMTKQIKLTQGQFTIVDDSDYEYLSHRKWYAMRQKSGAYYAVSNRTDCKGKKYIMHRVIMDAPQGILVDHRNHNTLNNIRSNLRLCTQAENQHNQVPQGGTSEFKGVAWHSRDKCWRAYITLDDTKIHLGTFYDECKAARAYDIGAVTHFGEFAYLNLLTPTEAHEIMAKGGSDV